jgi:hypothetical protein
MRSIATCPETERGIARRLTDTGIGTETPTETVTVTGIGIGIGIGIHVIGIGTETGIATVTAAEMIGEIDGAVNLPERAVETEID